MAYWIAAIIIVLLIATELIVSANRLKTVVYELKYENLPDAFDGYTIIHLSDLHGKRFGAHGERLLQAIQNIPADAIMMTGDMIDKFQSNHTSLIQLVADLKEYAPIYYVCGNHELYIGEEAWSNLKSSLTQAGARVLDNEKAELEKDGISIDCYGLCVPLYNYHGMNRYHEGDTTFGTEEIRGIFGSPHLERFNILLAHRPILFEEYAAWGADLTLSGHVHGGLIRLPHFGGLLSTEVSFFPKYDGGVFTEGKRKMVLSRGLGSGRFKFRFWNRPEIVVIRLKKG